MFSERKLSLNTLQPKSFERPVFRGKISRISENRFEKKKEFEKWPLITFFQCMNLLITAEKHVVRNG